MPSNCWLASPYEMNNPDRFNDFVEYEHTSLHLLSFVVLVLDILWHINGHCPKSPSCA